MAEQAKVETTAKATGRGGRGPSYPSIAIEEAITRAQQFWTAEKRNSAPIGAAAKHWSYSEKSSSGRLTVAALIQYGLLEDSGSKDDRMVKLTNRALNIVLDGPDSPSRLKAIQEAAQSPKIYADILSKWRANELPSDQTLRFYLLREKGFNDSTVDDVIRNFKASITFAKLDKGASISEMEEEKADKTKEQKGKNILKVTVGDYVQWESGGVLQLSQPRQVTGVSEDGQFVFVDGSSSGLPINEVTVTEVKSKPEAGPPILPNGVPTAITRSPVSFRQDIFSLDEGQVILQWPEKMSSASYEDFKAWLDLQVRKIGRAVKDE